MLDGHTSCEQDEFISVQCSHILDVSFLLTVKSSSHRVMHHTTVVFIAAVLLPTRACEVALARGQKCK